jgi:hypothetical protein
VNGLDVLKDINVMKESAEKVHQEVLEFISALSDDNSSDRASVVCNSSLSFLITDQGLIVWKCVFQVFTQVCRPIPYHGLSLILCSSNSLTLLPPEPKIFHGREAELSGIIQSFSHEVPRIAILGAGGMGKTTLSRAVLHHPEVTARYDQHRVFVPCDAVSTSIQLAGLIGTYIGLKPGKDLTGPVIRHFSSGPPTLLILDNLETIWEPAESRADVEKFLSHLTDVEHLAFIVSCNQCICQFN